tara:strand:- start:1056 stop:1259 length:204 start_codon:yes stop_codon:yes gene_type:complete
MAIFMAHGFGGASMDAIAEAVSVSKMTLFGISTARRCPSPAGSRNNTSPSWKTILPYHWQVCRYERR